LHSHIFYLSVVMSVYKSFCRRQECAGLERHFHGTCCNARRDQALQEAHWNREAEHAAFLRRQAWRDAEPERYAAFRARCAARVEQEQRMLDEQHTALVTREARLDAQLHQNSVAKAERHAAYLERQTRREEFLERQARREERHSAFLVRKAWREGKVDVKAENHLAFVARRERRNAEVEKDAAARALQAKRDAGRSALLLATSHAASKASRQTASMANQWVNQPGKKCECQMSEVSTSADMGETPPLSPKATKVDPLDPLVEKEIRKLEKKLREISQIEAALAAGKVADTQQHEKVATKDQLMVSLRRIKAV